MKKRNPTDDIKSNVLIYKWKHLSHAKKTINQMQAEWRVMINNSSRELGKAAFVSMVYPKSTFEGLTKNISIEVWYTGSRQYSWLIPDAQSVVYKKIAEMWFSSIVEEIYKLPDNFDLSSRNREYYEKYWALSFFTALFPAEECAANEIFLNSHKELMNYVETEIWKDFFKPWIKIDKIKNFLLAKWIRPIDANKNAIHFHKKFVRIFWEMLYRREGVLFKHLDLLLSRQDSPLILIDDEWTISDKFLSTIPKEKVKNLVCLNTWDIERYFNLNIFCTNKENQNIAFKKFIKILETHFADIIDIEKKVIQKYLSASHEFLVKISKKLNNNKENLYWISNDNLNIWYPTILKILQVFTKKLYKHYDWEYDIFIKWYFESVPDFIIRQIRKLEKKIISSSLAMFIHWEDDFFDFSNKENSSGKIFILNLQWKDHEIDNIIFDIFLSKVSSIVSPSMIIDDNRWITVDSNNYLEILTVCDTVLMANNFKWKYNVSDDLLDFTKNIFENIIFKCQKHRLKEIERITWILSEYCLLSSKDVLFNNENWELKVVKFPRGHDNEVNEYFINIIKEYCRMKYSRKADYIREDIEANHKSNHLL